MTSKNTLVFFAFLLLLASTASARSDKLEAYIQEAFTNNEILKQRSFELDKSMLSLKEAKTLFLPTTTLGASYTLAGGATRYCDYRRADQFHAALPDCNASGI